MEEKERFIIDTKNYILKLTDKYIADLQLLDNTIAERIPDRKLYKDVCEIELIKLRKFINTIEDYSTKAITESMINLDMRNKIKNLLIENLSETEAQIITLISQKCTKTQIAEQLNIKQSTLRTNLKNIGNKLTKNNEFIKRYLNDNKEEYNQIINEDNGFYSIFEFLQDFFNGL